VCVCVCERRINKLPLIDANLLALYNIESSPKLFAAFEYECVFVCLCVLVE
jgi:hypothetical protein